MVEKAAFVFVMAIAFCCGEIVGGVDEVDEGFCTRTVDLSNKREDFFYFIHCERCYFLLMPFKYN